MFLAPSEETSARLVIVHLITPNIKLGNILDQNDKLCINNDEIPESLARLLLLTKRKAKHQERVDHSNPATIHHSGQNHERVAEDMQV